MTAELCYCAPSYGGSGLMNIGMQVPGCFILFVGPASCGRHSSVGSFQKRQDHRNAYLFVSENDIALGLVEEEIIQAVGEIMARRDAKPEAFIVLLACDVFLMSIDEEGILSELSSSFLGTAFQICYMNPISIGTDHAPVTMMYARFAGFFDTEAPQDDSLNILGANVPIDPSCELFDVARAIGIREVRQTSNRASFEEFRRMGRSRWNLVVKPEGLRAARELAPRMGFRFVMPSYQPDEIRTGYEDLFDLVEAEEAARGIARTILDEAWHDARNALVRARKRTGSASFSVGSSTTYKPFGLARMLMEAGFTVSDLFTATDIYSSVPSFDRAGYEWVSENGACRIHGTCGSEMRLQRGSTCDVDFALGFNAAYFSNARHVVTITNDEGCFGFQGMRRVAEAIEESIDHPRNLRDVMDAYGVIV